MKKSGKSPDIRSCLFSDAKASSFEMFLRKPTLLWFIRDLGLTTQTGMSFLCIIGIFLGVLGIASKAWRDFTSFLTMWFLYFSLYQVSVFIDTLRHVHSYWRMKVFEVFVNTYSR